MKKILFGALALLATPPALAGQYSIQIQNLMRGTFIAPILVAAHPPGTRLFEAGSPASANLQKMAEGGDISGVTSDMQAVGATIQANPNGGPLAPGKSVTTTLDTDNAPANTQLTIVGMLVPTNDGFIGLNGITLPNQPGTYSYDVNAYDAGTEANDEIRGSGVPGQPGMPVPAALDSLVGHNGTGVPATAEGFVHIHRGVLGDTDPNGGISDLDSTMNRWLNPVVHVTVTVK